MHGEELAKAVESTVLNFLSEHPFLVLTVLKDGLDKYPLLGVDLATILQAKMTPAPTPPPQLSAFVTATDTVKALCANLEQAEASAKEDLIRILVGNGLCTENKAKDLANDAVEAVVNEAIDDRMREFPDEDQVRDLINGAWNGA